MKKLGEVATNFMYGMNAAATVYDGENQYIRITDIDERTRLFTPNPLSSPDGELEDKYLLEKGDILFARTGASVGKSYLYSEKDGKIFFAGFLIRLNVKTENPYFIFSQTLTEKYQKWVLTMSMRSGQPGINAEEYKLLPIALPSFEEQSKIASFLSKIDERITTQNKIIKELKTLKASTAKKIFSQELRFKDDNGNDFPEWEVREVGEVFKITRGNVLAMNLVSNQCNEKNTYPVYSSQTKNNGLAGYYTDFLFEDAITWTTDGANAGDVNYRSGKFYCTNVCGVLISNEGYANSCIAELINSVSKNYVSYVGNPKLMNGVMSEIKIPFPSLPEQTKIANFLSAIDSKIDMENQLLQKLEEQKKYLLQNMFV